MVQEIIQTIVDSMPLVLERTIEIAKSPIINTEMIWLLAPLIITLLAMEFYFGRYKDEELGWNSAYGNALVLVFVSASLAKHIYMNELYFSLVKLSAVAVVIFMGLELMFIDFFHILPKKIAFNISSKVPINFLAFVAIVLVYTELPLDNITLIAFVVLLLLLLMFIGLIHALIPKVRTKFLPHAPVPTKKEKVIAPKYDETT
ncbi:hypothetical protein HOD61_00300 [archaeon]|nr:hypothetical protein [archaeon]